MSSLFPTGFNSQRAKKTQASRAPGTTVNRKNSRVAKDPEPETQENMKTGSERVCLA